MVAAACNGPEVAGEVRPGAVVVVVEDPEVVVVVELVLAFGLLQPAATKSAALAARAR
ncbi:MAG: hypothetical protein ACRDV6_10370 [Acidimicrobiales bacterium]